MLTNIEIEKNKQEFISELGKVNRPGIDKLIEWLSDPNPQVCDFFIAPSSSTFHGNYKGGLCEHSLNVYHNLVKLNEMYKTMMTEIGKDYVPYTDEQLIITSLLHDLCKIQYYEEIEKWFKDDSGKWQSYQGYKVTDRFPLGHGEKSVYLAQQFIQVTGVEALAIRWHMGLDKPAHNIDPTEKKSLSDAWIMCPLAYLLHQADSMSAFLMEDMIDPQKKHS